MGDFHFSPRPNRAHEINWHKWGYEAFRQAQQEDKLVLLSIGAVWCHWCHVMDEEAYSDQTNIDLINQRFIPIKVDNDRQPDINRRYNMGGWPTTAILSPEGELIQGGTYLPTENLTRFLQELDQIYHQNREDITQKLRDFYERQREEFDQIRERELHEDMILAVRGQILESYDTEWGGFGREPKFPHPEVLDFLLDEYYRTGNADLREVIQTTLINMSERGMFDPEMGGFFRYSTDREWNVPHFEKMLEDNAKLLSICLKAYQIFNDGRFKDTALDVIMYMQDWLIDHEHGLFYGSQDADESYYRKTRQQREDLPAPFVDKTIYTSWNALAMSAFLRAFGVLEALDCRDIALRGIDFLMTHCFNPEEGMYHFYSEGEAHNTRLLEDQLAMSNVLLDAYEVTHLKCYLEEAEQLVHLTMKRFHDERQGGFFVDLPDIGALGIQQMAKLEKPMTINSCMAELLLRLEAFTGKNSYREIAMRTLRLCADLYPEYGLFAAPFGRAASAAIHGVAHITIVGNYDDPVVRALFQECLKNYVPHRVIEELDPIQDRHTIEARGYEPNAHQAYVCKGTQCFPPVTDPEELSGLLAGKNCEREMVTV